MLEKTIKAKADMVGFVHFAKSPRHLELEEIAELITQAKPRIKSVILLVNPDDGLLEKTALLQPDYIQLHGNESLERITEIKQKYNIAIVKALAIASVADLEQVAHYNKIADMIILDAKAPKNSANPGGMGKAFDWNILKSLASNIKFMLSGGLDIDNVAKAVSFVRPYGLDVSSGVEIERGKKDAKMISQFIKNAREAAK